MEKLSVCLLVCVVMALTRAAAVPEPGPPGKAGAGPPPPPPQKPQVLMGGPQVMRARMPCPSGWTLINNRCFYYESRYLTWANAEVNCQFLGGNLASVHTTNEYQLLQSLSLRATNAYPYLWLGGSDAQQEGSWFWIDGTGFRFTYWAAGQPDGSGNCLAMNYGDERKLDDQLCGYGMPSICSRRA